MTEWRVIPGFSRYSASEEGDLRRDVRMRTGPGLVAQRPDSYGYLSVSLTDDDGRERKVQTHRLIAAAFLGPNPPGLIVCHGPAGKLVNTPSNLRYDTYAANNADMLRDGTALTGSRHPSSKLDERKVAEILQLIVARNLTHKQIGALYSVDGACIGRIALGLTWRHVPRPTDMPPPRRALNSSKHARVAEFEFRRVNTKHWEGAAA